MEKYQVWAEAVQKELQSNTNWVEAYKNYAEDMLENESKIEECKKKFNVPKPLECYVTLGNIAKGKTIYDLRYLGQSVGEIHIENGKPILVVSEKKQKQVKNTLVLSLVVLAVNYGQQELKQKHLEIFIKRLLIRINFQDKKNIW